MEFEPVIGLEVHVQLKTESKIFCSCSTKFGQEQNTSVCPVCLGLPGTLPVLNEQVVLLGIKAGLALNCKVRERFKFDRKNYFYPDLPKAYQISQYDLPLCYEGNLSLYFEGKSKNISIVRAHLEEDAGKLLHDEVKRSAESQVDYNRTGTPLLEIVSGPDMRSSKEAYAYLTTLKAILEYLEVSDCNMQEGSLRCDANVSVRPAGQTELGTKTEIKNMNSFKAVEKAITFEIARQIEMIAKGERVIQETRLWDADDEKTYSMRSKEEAHDYRYFPEPDLPYVTLSLDQIETVKRSLPELPHSRAARFMNDYKIPEYDASILVADKKMADFFEASVREFPQPKVVSNWIMVDLFKKLNERNISLAESGLKPGRLARLLELVDNNTISLRAAKDVFDDLFAGHDEPLAIVQRKGLAQVSDSSALEKIVDEVIAKNAKSVEDYKAGETKAISFLMGQAMKLSGGKANPKMINEMLQSRLKTGG